MTFDPEIKGSLIMKVDRLLPYVGLTYYCQILLFFLLAAFLIS